ncbi:helix-turn-helix transcriptional regulator [Azospirillum canadense]|uniref:helix-turn-helix transcriptional regulator n=1 Tax=Azospirillum canadense TaxID=403962 RepID=UPI003873A3F6
MTQALSLSFPYPTRSLPARTQCGYITYTMEYPNRLAELRKRAGVSQGRLADALNSGRSTIVKLEKGERELSLDWMERIAPILGCAPWDLLPEAKSEHHKEIEMRLRYRAMTAEQRNSILSVAQQMVPKRG